MLARLKAYLRPPILSSEDETRTGYFLYVVIGVGVFTLLLLLLGFYFSATLDTFQALMLGLFILPLLISYFLLQNRRIEAASQLFLATFFILMAGAITFTGGLYATTYSSLLLLIFCTGLLLGRRTMLWFAIGVAVLTLGLFLLEVWEMMPAIRGPQTALTRAITQAINLIAVTGFTYYSLRRIEVALTRAVLSEQTLLASNQQLQEEVRERKQIEQTLAHNHALLQATFDAVPDGILVVDLAQQFVATNGRFRQMWGLPEEVFEAEEARKLVNDKLSDSQVLDQRINDSHADSTRERYMVIEMKDGTVFESFSLPQLLDGEPVGRVWTYRDVTLLKQAEQAARTSERQFRDLFELAPIGMAITDLGGKILQVNPAFCRTVGYSPTELFQRTFAQITHPDDLGTNLQLYQQLLNQEISAYQYEKRYVRKNGTAVNVFLQVSALRDDHDRPAQLMAQVVDLTDLRQAEETVRQAQKLESLGLMSSGIAHDFNNLLTAILTQASLAQAKLPTDSPALRHILRMVEASQRAAGLTQQLLTFSGRGQRQSQPLSLNIVIQENLSLLEVAVPKAVRLETALVPQLPLINGDEGQLQQVIMNLVINAAEAMGNGEEANGRSNHVRLVTKTQTVIATQPVRLATGERLPLGDYVRLDVADSGSGMDEVTVVKIFDPFFTTKKTGHGLGLATVMGIVRSHGGGMQVTSKIGKGTTFHLFFPALAPGNEEAAAETAVAASSSTTIHAPLAALHGLVLVIDDEAPVREAVMDVLALEGVGVLTAVDGQSGLDLYQQRCNDIALIVLDISMPGLSGIETLARLRQFAPGVPVILSSGYSSEPSGVTAALRQSHTHFLQKPYRWDELLDKIRPFLQPT